MFCIMRWLKCSLLLTAICATYGQDSATQTNSVGAENTRENQINFHDPNPAILDSTENIFNELTANLTQNAGNTTATRIQPLGKDVQIISKSGGKQEIENMTFNDIKPFLLFPILPFLLPPREEENLKRDALSNQKNETAKTEKTTDVKPFILFDFAFNIRRVSINNRTDNANESEVNNVGKLDNVKPTPPPKNRKRRHAKTKVDTPGFFDDSLLFPDSELDEFLPKPDLFFPDLPFHHKPLKKLSRKKRDQNKPEMKNDLKSFFDTFDEAFAQTKNELKWADPILNFLMGGEQFQDEKKVADDPFSQPPVSREKPSMKLRIQRNIKRLNNEPQVGLLKPQDSPTIIVDKVVKIGEFHVHDKNKNKRKDTKGKFLGRGNHDEVTLNENIHIPSAFKHGDMKRKKRNHFVGLNPEGHTYTKIHTEEIRILPKLNTSFLLADGKTTQLKKKDELRSKKTPTSDARYENVKKIDSLKTKINMELTNGAIPSAETLNRKGSDDKQTSKKTLREDLKKNITQLLNQFLTVVKNLDGTKLVERLEDGERNHAGIFDWTEKETLQNVLGKSSIANREKKDAYFEDEYGDLSMKERQVADLNYLFLGVTVPTILVFTLVMLTCFYSLHVKGKICTKLFKTRQVFLVDNEGEPEFTRVGSKKIQPI